MNPLDMMKFSSLWSTFTANHPKFPKFIAAASRKGVLAEGSVIAMQITTPNGETLETNLKITASDLELVQQLKKMRLSVSEKSSFYTQKERFRRFLQNYRWQNLSFLLYLFVILKKIPQVRKCRYQGLRLFFRQVFKQ